MGLVYVFNLIVGTGALTLPAAFAGAGWLFSSILLILLACVSFITATFVIESVASANATIQWKRIQSHKIDVSLIFSYNTFNNLNLLINSKLLKYIVLMLLVSSGELSGK